MYLYAMKAMKLTFNLKQMKKIIITTALLIITLTCSAQKLTSNERTFWNGFCKYVELNGMKGSKLLDNHDTAISKALFFDFNTLNGTHYDYTTFVTRVQVEISAYRAKALEQIHAGKATCNCTTDAEFMPGLSVIDGWAGSKTTSWYFPSDTVPVYRNGVKAGTKPNNVY